MKLTNKEKKLLLSILEEARDNRQDMTCNDANNKEQKLFSKKERMKICKKYLEDMDEDEIKDGYMFNFQYVEYLIKRIE